MRKLIPSLLAALWLNAISPVEAIPIYGTFSGVVTGTGDGLVSYPAGTAVSGSYAYNSDLLFFNSNGQRQTSYSDPMLFFLVNIDGQGFGYSSQNPCGLSFTVDSNGLPVSGSAAGLWDIYIGSGGIGLSTFGGNFIATEVTYATPSVPDAGTTSYLMVIALVCLPVARRCVHPRR